MGGGRGIEEQWNLFCMKINFISREKKLYCSCPAWLPCKLSSVIFRHIIGNTICVCRFRRQLLRVNCPRRAPFRFSSELFRPCPPPATPSWPLPRNSAGHVLLFCIKTESFFYRWAAQQSTIRTVQVTVASYDTKIEVKVITQLLKGTSHP